ncbi:MAG: hypothetical protein Q4F83_09340 [Eubacteriales bacterium]|nr:hypothetical protein [Eubacteriales bacterium]
MAFSSLLFLFRFLPAILLVYYIVPELTDYEIQTVTDCFEGTIQSKLGIGTAGDTIELFFPLTEPAYTVYRESTEITENSLYNLPHWIRKINMLYFLEEMNHS